MVSFSESTKAAVSLELHLCVLKGGFYVASATNVFDAPVFARELAEMLSQSGEKMVRFRHQLPVAPKNKKTSLQGPHD